MVSRYTLMALVTVSTIYQTVYVAIILLISKGWTILRETMNRQDAMKIMMLLGAVYLSYSAYYVSFGLENIKSLIGASISVLFIVLFGIIMFNSFEVLAMINQLRMMFGDHEMQQNNMRSLHLTLRLK